MGQLPFPILWMCFRLQGMVLCACNDDHSIVQFVDPPANSKPGDQVIFEGFAGAPATPANMAKKKVFEALAPQVVVLLVLCAGILLHLYLASNGSKWNCSVGHNTIQNR